MYHEYIIHTLSPVQLRKIMKGDKVRMRKNHNHGSRVYLTKEQVHQIELAHSKNKGTMISFSESQIKHHTGKGLFDTLKSFAKKHKDIINPLIQSVKKASHAVVRKTANSLHNKITSIPELSGEGMKKRRRGRPRKGKGILSDVLGGLSKGSELLGFGIRKRRTLRKKTHGGSDAKGKGILGNIAKSVLPSLVDAGANAIKSKIAGGKIRKSKKTTAAKKTRKHRKVSGKSLFPAGYGGALFPSGYGGGCGEC